jgi:hypothetical protein
MGGDMAQDPSGWFVSLRGLDMADPTLAAKLEEHRQVAAWAADPHVPEPVRAYLAKRAARVAAEVVAAWAERGGQVDLRPETAAPAPVPLHAPAPVAVTSPPSLVIVERPAAPERPAYVDRPQRPEPQPTAFTAAPAGPPAAVDALARLKQHLESGGAAEPEPEPIEWGPQLTRILGGLSPGKDDEAELDRVHAVVGECQTWVIFPPDVQRGLIAHTAARLRILQERGMRDRRIDQAFLTLTAYSARERPGFVIGLNRTHKPVRGTWQDDADNYWDRLVSYLPTEDTPSPNHEKILANLEKLVREIEFAPVAARSAVASQTIREFRTALESGISARDPRLVRLAAPLVEQLQSREFRNLRRAIREEQEAANEPEDAEATTEEVHLPPEWGWWGRTKGRRALMIGGSPREPNRARLEKVFGFSSLEWLPAEHRRNSLVSVRNRVRAGGVDVVLILRSFVGHDADEIILPACRETGVDWVHVDQGYGVVRVRQAIERFLDPSEPARAAP